MIYFKSRQKGATRLPPVFFEQRPEEFFIGEMYTGSFPDHLHDVVEIVCLTKGGLVMSIDGKEYSLCPGDIALAFPASPHGFVSATADAEGLSLIFAPDILGEFAFIFRSQTLAQPLLRAEDKPSALADIIQKLQNLPGASHHPLSLAYLHLFLAYLFSEGNLHLVEKNPHSSLSCQVLQYVSQHFAEPLSLDSVSRALGISRIHLSHVFSQQLHINFRQYINNLRIDRACLLLRDPAYSVSQIVYLCGYGNARTFNRAFMAQCGITPKRYRSRFTGTFPEEEDEEE